MFETLEKLPSMKQVGLLNSKALQDTDIKRKDKIAKDLRECMSYLVFRHYYKKDDVRLKAANSCKRHLLCPACAARRAVKYAKKATGTISCALEKDSALKPIFLTLTVKSSGDLAPAWNKLIDGKAKLLQRMRDTKKGNAHASALSDVAGGIWSAETTWSKEKGWHPHIHALILSPKWIDQEALSREWKGITGDSFIVDLRRVKDLEKSCFEVCKYGLKFDGLPPVKAVEAYRFLKGKHLFRAFGNLRGLKVPAQLTDELIAGDEPYLDLVYRYYFREKQYRCIKVIPSVEEKKDPLSFLAREKIPNVEIKEAVSFLQDRSKYPAVRYKGHVFTRNHPRGANGRRLTYIEALTLALTKAQEVDREIGYRNTRFTGLVEMMGEMPRKKATETCLARNAPETADNPGREPFIYGQNWPLEWAHLEWQEASGQTLSYPEQERLLGYRMRGLSP